MNSSPMISFVTGSDRDLIEIDEATALRASGTLIIDDRRTRTRYFDGRFLAAKDEIRDQNYFLTRLADLGRAGGTGVVSGLMVSLSGPTSILIQAGQGVTPAGETLIAPTAVTIALADLATADRLNVAFGLSRIPTELSRNRTGLFVLGLRPVEYTANPVASYPTTLNGPRSVQDGDIIEAAAVVLVPYVEQGAQSSADTRRSRVARQVFLDYGSLGIQQNVLPLAMLALDRGVVQWIDPYLVRREIGTEQGGILGFGFAPRALREAYIQQYLNQLRDVLQARGGSNLGQTFAASEYFESLPAAGAMPSGAINPADFSQIFFPPQVQTDLSIIPEDELQVLIEESLMLPPIDLTDSADELESTSVVMLVPIPRAQLPSLTHALTSLTRLVRPAAPGLIFQRKPLESLRGLTALRIPAPLVNVQNPIDAAWRRALLQHPLVWYVRRRNLQLRREVIGTRVRVSGDEFAMEKALADRLTAMGLIARFDALKAKSSAAAVAEITTRLASAAMADKMLTAGAIHELEPIAAIDRAAALNVTSRYSDPHLGEGLARLKQIDAGLNDAAVIDAIASCDSAPELDRIGRSPDSAALAAIATQVITLAKTPGPDSLGKLAEYIRSRPELSQ